MSIKKIFTFRIDEKILSYLEERAERNSRSIAKELEYIVKQLYLKESNDLDVLLEKVFAAYSKEKPESLQKVMSSDADTPLKTATLELLDFVKSL